MEPTAATTPEAKLGNRPTYSDHRRGDDIDERGGRMTVYADLPNGRIWDEVHAALVRDVNETWAPFTVLRKQLIEAGWRAIGPQMLLSEDEQAAFWRHREALNGVHGDEERATHQQQGSGITPYPRPR